MSDRPIDGLVIRDATADDLRAVIDLYADDMLGVTREAPGPEVHPAYRTAFAAIEADPRNRLLVADLDGRVVGVLQLTIIPGLSRTGTQRALIEGVHVASDVRGMRIGRHLAEWAITEARAEGCGMVQLTSDLRRSDAHRFWASVGFEHTHVGMKLILPPA